MYLELDSEWFIPVLLSFCFLFRTSALVQDFPFTQAFYNEVSKANSGEKHREKAFSGGTLSRS